MNPLSKVSILGAAGLLALAGWLVDQWYRSLYVTQVNVVRTQPVQFSHEHHVTGLGIDCRYCHTSVETSSFAGIPATEVCMNCHSIIWNDSPKLEPVRESFRTGKPIVWTRVHDVPDFVYFNHSIHVAKG
ncbi:MAG TPA: cytochrome c3 family protein, partial [Pirellulales bacterium]|nr:cytochrome c3 family protein [Pirellulales bacterium]